MATKEDLDELKKELLSENRKREENMAKTMKKLTKTIEDLAQAVVTKEHFDQSITQIRTEIKNNTLRIIAVEQDIQDLKESNAYLQNNQMSTLEILNKELPLREAKKHNIMMHGIIESTHATGEEKKKHDERVAMEIFQNIEAKIEPTDINTSYRIGKVNQGKTRPLIIKFEEKNSSECKRNIFKSVKNLKKSALYSRISISNDLTKLERAMQKSQIQELQKTADERNHELNDRNRKWIVTGRPHKKQLRLIEIDPVDALTDLFSDTLTGRNEKTFIGFSDSS